MLRLVTPEDSEYWASAVRVPTPLSITSLQASGWDRVFDVSLVPETCLEFPGFASLILDSAAGLEETTGAMNLTN